MSQLSKLTFATTLIGTAGIVAFMHWAQVAERAAMHAGVVRDVENQRRKAEEMDERRIDFEMQKRLEEEYRKTQSVHDSTTGG